MRKSLAFKGGAANNKAVQMIKDDEILMANDQMYEIIGNPKSNELTPEFTTALLTTLNGGKSNNRDNHHLIFTKKCLFPLVNEDGSGSRRQHSQSSKNDPKFVSLYQIAHKNANF